MYEFPTGRGAEIANGLDRLEIYVRRDASDTSLRAKLQLNGTVRISAPEKVR